MTETKLDEVLNSVKASAPKQRNRKKQKLSTSSSKFEPAIKDNKDGPWYQIFTKGDEEYDQYMATEWGFEQVSDRSKKSRSR